MTIGKNTDDSAFDTSLMARSPYYDDFDPQKKFAVRSAGSKCAGTRTVNS